MVTAPHPALPLLVATTTLLVASATLALGEFMQRRGKRIPGWDAIFWGCVGVVAVVFLASLTVAPSPAAPLSDAPVTVERTVLPSAQRSPR